MNASQQDRHQERLAKAILDQTLTDAIEREQEKVRSAKEQLRRSKKTLQEARRRRRQWRIGGSLDRGTELQALGVAQVADLVPSNVPDNAHHEAVRNYLIAHDPPRSSL